MKKARRDPIAATKSSFGKNSLFRLLSSRNPSVVVDGTKLNSNNAGIDSIDGNENEKLPISLTNKITTLYLSNNYLKCIYSLNQFSNLRVLALSNNDLNHYQDVLPLKALTHLEKLSLDGNPIILLPFYRDFIVNLCPQLTVLDDRRVLAKEVKAATYVATKLSSFMSTMKLNEFQITILKHFLFLRKCHLSILNDVLPKYRSMAGSHLRASRDSSESPWNTSFLLRQAIKGGVFRYLQGSAEVIFDKICQDHLRHYHVKCLRVMTADEKRHFHSSWEARESYWKDLISESVKNQQLILLEIAEEIEATSDSRVKGSVLAAAKLIDFAEPPTIIAVDHSAPRRGDIEQSHALGCGVEHTCANISTARSVSSTKVNSSVPTTSQMRALSASLPPQQTEPEVNHDRESERDYHQEQIHAVVSNVDFVPSSPIDRTRSIESILDDVDRALTELTHLAFPRFDSSKFQDASGYLQPPVYDVPSTTELKSMPELKSMVSKAFETAERSYRDECLCYNVHKALYDQTREFQVKIGSQLEDMIRIFGRPQALLVEASHLLDDERRKQGTISGREKHDNDLAAAKASIKRLKFEEIEGMETLAKLKKDIEYLEKSTSEVAEAHRALEVEKTSNRDIQSWLKFDKAWELLRNVRETIAMKFLRDVFLSFKGHVSFSKRVKQIEGDAKSNLESWQKRRYFSRLVSSHSAVSLLKRKVHRVQILNALKRWRRWSIAGRSVKYAMISNNNRTLRKHFTKFASKVKVMRRQVVLEDFICNFFLVKRVFRYLKHRVIERDQAWRRSLNFHAAMILKRSFNGWSLFQRALNHRREVGMKRLLAISDLNTKRESFSGWWTIFVVLKYQKNFLICKYFNKFNRLRRRKRLRLLGHKQMLVMLENSWNRFRVGIGILRHESHYDRIISMHRLHHAFSRLIQRYFFRRTAISSLLLSMEHYLSQLRRRSFHKLRCVQRGPQKDVDAHHLRMMFNHFKRSCRILLRQRRKLKFVLEKAYTKAIRFFFKQLQNLRIKKIFAIAREVTAASRTAHELQSNLEDKKMIVLQLRLEYDQKQEKLIQDTAALVELEESINEVDVSIADMKLSIANLEKTKLLLKEEERSYDEAVQIVEDLVNNLNKSGLNDDEEMASLYQRKTDLLDRRNALVQEIELLEIKTREVDESSSRKKEAKSFTVDHSELCLENTMATSNQDVAEMLRLHKHSLDNLVALISNELDSKDFQLKTLSDDEAIIRRRQQLCLSQIAELTLALEKIRSESASSTVEYPMSSVMSVSQPVMDSSISALSPHVLAGDLSHEGENHGVSYVDVDVSLSSSYDLGDIDSRAREDQLRNRIVSRLGGRGPGQSLSFT